MLRAMRLAVYVLTSWLVLLSPPTVDAQGEATLIDASEGPSAALRARAERLTARLAKTSDPAASTALEQGRLALSRVEEARLRGDVEAAVRGERVADAALTLAERRLALTLERRAMDGAKSRARDARMRVEAARAALEAAKAAAAEAAE